MKTQPIGFEGVRVVEFAGSGVAAAYAGWSLAQMGAEVIRLVSPGHAPDRRAASPIGLALEVLADGKIAVDCPHDAAAFDALLADQDILICDTPATLQALAGPLPALCARLPRLVVGVATTFGLDGPYSGYPGTSLDAQALSGVSWSIGEPTREALPLLARSAADANLSVLARQDGVGIRATRAGRTSSAPAP